MVVTPNPSDVFAAQKRLRGWAYTTPVIRNCVLDERAGLQIFLKLENLQRTGTFKFRGAFNRLTQLSEAERDKGVVAFSSGNHAQGVAEAARLLGIPAMIVMPADAPAIKVENTKALGARVISYDRYSESREEIAAGLAQKHGCVLVPPYDDFHVIAGQGTVGMEFVQQLQAMSEVVEGVLICCGGGGLTAGSALAIHELLPSAAIYTTEPEGFDDTARSLLAGKRVSNEASATSFCDALLAPTPGELTFAINRRLVKAGVVVTDAEVARAISFGFRHLKIVLEPGGAVTLAAALAGKIPPGLSSAGLVCSGGNVDAAVFMNCLNDFPDP